MSIQWILVETIAVLAENFACLYFLHSRFASKHDSVLPQAAAWLAATAWGLTATFADLPMYEFIAYSIFFLYLFFFKRGTVPQKIFGVLLTASIQLGTALTGAGLAALMSSVTIAYTMEYQDIPRLLNFLFVKTLDVVIFYLLAKKHYGVRNLQKAPAIVLGVAAVIDFSFMLAIYFYALSSNTRDGQTYLLVWPAAGALFVMIGIFLIYELFIREEARNVELAMQLQRLELEANFFNEIDAMYSDMRKWRHEYKNNLSALRGLISGGDMEKLLKYIDNIDVELSEDRITLQTGNLVLDAIVSSKLRLAQLQNIEVTIQAVYPENNRIEDSDLCAVAGNLLDNALEACIRMGDIPEKKFIKFSLMLKGKNLLLQVSNSYNSGELKREGARFLTVKKEPFHGIGIRYVDSIVDKYQGHILRSGENGVFETHVMLPLLPPDDNGGGRDE
jgi:hypothetical protein